MDLVFYSGGDNTLNESFDLEVAKLVSKNDAQFTFIPAKSDFDRKYFNRFTEYYSKYGFHNFSYFDIDEEYDPDKLEEVLPSDVIYLSGGNTFRFLYNIKQRGLTQTLIEFAYRPNTILIGMSAGSMIMTPTIRTTAIYHQHKGDFDELNKLGLDDFTGLGLVDFEFVPHFTQETKGAYVDDFVRGVAHPIYGCPDGSGIIVKDNKVVLHGEIITLKI